MNDLLPSLPTCLDMMPVLSSQNVGFPKQVCQGLEEREWTEVEPLGMTKFS